MGAAGSSIPDAIDADTFKAFCGDKFDQAKYDALEKDEGGNVSKAKFEELIAADAAAAAPAADAAAAPAAAHVKIKLTDLTKAIESAQEAKLTPLVVDRSAAHLADTFFGYGGGVLVDAKAASLKVARKDITLEESQANLRAVLSTALANGKQIVFACQQASPAMGDLCHDGFPVETFTAGAIATDAWAEKIVTDDDAKQYTAGMKMANAKFNMIVSSWFAVEDMEDFLFADGMGFAKIGKAPFQIIEIEHEEGTELIE